jgi:uncharacterized membrane protein
MEAMMPATPVVMIHVATALLAVIVGATVLLMKKGSRLHKLAGRSWVALMATTALVSFGIRSGGHFSWIHLLSVFMLLVLAYAIVSIVRGNVLAHRRNMMGAYAGLVIAGLFTLLPGRMLGRLVWQSMGLV